MRSELRSLSTKPRRKNIISPILLETSNQHLHKVFLPKCSLLLTEPPYQSEKTKIPSFNAEKEKKGLSIF